MLNAASAITARLRALTLCVPMRIRPPWLAKEALYTG